MPSETRWQIYPANRELSEKIGTRINRNPIIAQILLNRKIRSMDQARVFMSPELDSVSDTLNTEQLDICVALLSQLKPKSRIAVFGDYDVDGMTSTSIMTDFLTRMGFKVDFHIPHRFSEGYGLNEAFITKVINGNHSLLITLDCGISNEKEIAYLKANRDIPVIILDHHTLPSRLPAADCILNPRMLHHHHPMYHLCTAGIVYHTVHYVARALKLDFDAEEYLDLAALGTIADVVPLVDYNRALAKLGLKTLAARKRVGLRELLEVSDLKPVISAVDVGFKIAPRLNAAGRLSHARLGVELMLNKDENSAREMAQQLQQINQKRRQTGTALFAEADAHIKANPHLLENQILVLSGTGWHSGVIGITCSQLVQKYARPVVLIAVDDGMGRGSARTQGPVNIYEQLLACEQFFIDFGGHKEAAGFSIQEDQILPFMKALIAHANATVNPKDLQPVIEIDAKVDPVDLNLDLVSELAELAPFGAGNAEPILYTNALTAIDFRCVGETQNHLKITFTDQSKRFIVDGIGFSLGHKIDVLAKKHVEVAFTLEANTWNGKTVPQMKIVDIR